MIASKFFSSIKKSLYSGHLDQGQVDGINIVLRASEGLPTKHRAYLLATTYHETAKTMQPIHEYGGVKYFDKYDTGKLAATLGNTPEKDGDGYLYRGRGYVMITGRSNYSKFSSILGVDLIKDPEKACDPDIAAKILVIGCTQGLFTSKKLSDYNNYPNMRKVINGVDDAHLIAGYADKFEEAFNVSQ
jgi:putative chitinase